MNILITGSAGFIGQHLVAQLKTQGNHNLTLIDIEENQKKENNIMKIRSSFGETHLLDSVLPNQDIVFHLAAVLGVDYAVKNNEQLRKTNLTDTKLLIDKAEEHGVGKFIFSSSSEVYGNSPAIPFKETGDISPVSDYGRFKIEIEEYLEQKAVANTLHSTIVRFFNVYGPGQRQDFVVNKFIKAAKKNMDIQVNWDGTQTRCFTYVEDAVRGLLATMKHDKKPFDVFNIGNPREISIFMLAKMIIEAHPLSTSNIVILNRKNVTRYDIARRVPSLLKAERDLGYIPVVHLEKGVNKIINNG